MAINNQQSTPIQGQKQLTEIYLYLTQLRNAIYKSKLRLVSIILSLTKS